MSASSTDLAPRCLVIGNAGLHDVGFVGDQLERRGFRLEPVMREHPSSWPSPADADLVLILGSDWAVYAQDTGDVVRAEIELVRDAHRRGVPVLGVCFGAQVLAAALGGSVQPAARLELGWCEVETDEPC